MPPEFEEFEEFKNRGFYFYFINKHTHFTLVEEEVPSAGTKFSLGKNKGKKKKSICCTSFVFEVIFCFFE